ncbi:MAG: aminoglycoside/choline kinase family phosphotransferase [Oleiphilaceae bacterium]|jgi:aminoglycoside/choline kinase family phosphotransferase
MDLRQEKLADWVAKVLNQTSLSLDVVSGDASFRRYFRVNVEGVSWVAMDAPPEKEDSSSFVAIAQHWLSQGIQVPAIEHYDLELGFLLLHDFGDDILLASLYSEAPKSLSNKAISNKMIANNTAGDRYYGLAMQTLAEIQAINLDENYTLPPYDAELLRREMALFPDWLLEKKLGLTLTEDERAMLMHSFNLLAESALAQPQVPVHRDYHARNLMVLNDGSLGVIDFQDAVFGPVTYDLVSLLRDCYIVWPDEKVAQWCQHYFVLLQTKGQLHCDAIQFKAWFDLMGLQRHLKAAGIFARLSLRDGKHGYLDDIPRTVDYLARVSQKHSSLKAFHSFLVTKVQPLIKNKLIVETVLEEDVDV